MNYPASTTDKIRDAIAMCDELIALLEVTEYPDEQDEYAITEQVISARKDLTEWLGNIESNLLRRTAKTEATT